VGQAARSLVQLVEVHRLDYLEGLGINCLSLMPITPVKHEFDWGYGPLGYFAPEDYLGGPDGLKRLVDTAHARGIAVVLDVVYGHAESSFAYGRVYDDIRQLTGLHVPNPMMQDPNHDQFGRGFDHDQAMTRDYCLAANLHWLTEYHVDGFRYDNVPGFYDRNPGASISIEQITLKPPTENSRGLRLGSFVLIRDVIDDELEQAFSGKKSAQAAMDSAVERGNRLLRQFERASPDR